jgi:MFS transporter, PAT family, beta-lactamase induction signal transducer AmpG
VSRALGDEPALPAAERRRALPLWLMGLTNAPFGMYGGILVISVPELLNARHVSEATISAMTAVTISPGFWSIVASPMLDVRFSRRWYSTVTAVVAAVLLSLGLFCLDDVLLAEILLVTGFFAANLYQSALGGWLSSIIAPEERNTLSVWVTIANISGGGAMAIVAGELMQRYSPVAAVLTLGALLLLPIAVFPWMPAPGPDRRLASESFRQFFAEVVGVVRRPQVLLAIAMFVTPASSFSLVNLLSGLGSDFGASAHFVGAVGGAGVLFAGIAGCLVFPLIDRLLPLRYLYLTIGIVGAVFTLTLMLLPRTPLAFATALIGENVFQSAAITTSIAIAFETIGHRNPLAATTFSVIVSVLNIPNTYMVVVDGWGYAWRGVQGSLLVDAGASLAACSLLVLLLGYLSMRRRAAAEVAVGNPTAELPAPAATGDDGLW